MRDIFREYIDNVNEVSDSMTVTVSPDMSEEEVIGRIQRNAGKLYSLHKRNDEILNEVLFSKKPETVTDEEIAELTEFADALGRLDYPIFYVIYKLCHDAAVIRGDRRLLIRSCYWMSTAMFYMRLVRQDAGIDLFTDQVAGCLAEVQDFMDDYDSFDDPDTKGYIIRTNANRRLVSSRFAVIEGFDETVSEKSYLWFRNYLEIVKSTVALVTDPKKREGCPELPWDNFLYLTCFSFTSSVSKLRESCFTPDEYKIVSEYAKKAAEYVYGVEKKRAEAAGRPIMPEVLYRYHAARYHVGEISPKELIEEFLKIYRSAEPNDFTSNGLFTNLRLPILMQYYSKQLDEKSQEAYENILLDAQDKTSEYLMRMPRNQYANELSSDLRETLWYRSGTGMTYRQQVLEYILACHPPTYIHSHMVAWLTEKLFLRLCDTNPETLRGVLGIENVATIVADKHRLAKTARLCGLYHDIGKCMIMEHIGNYSRKLTDEEFLAIKYHPVLGADLLTKLGGFEDHAQAAFNHHRFFDGKGGYPAGKAVIPRRSRAVIDIITVADSLEAGTDNIGRCYAETKSVETLFDEIKRWSGTRYAPYVAELFNDKDFCDEVKVEIAAQRRKIYFETYIELSRSDDSRFHFGREN